MKLRDHPYKCQILCALICASLFMVLTIYISYNENTKALPKEQKLRGGQSNFLVR